METKAEWNRNQKKVIKRVISSYKHGMDPAASYIHRHTQTHARTAQSPRYCIPSDFVLMLYVPALIIFLFQSFQTLQTLIHACLDQANTDGYRTIAIPALGTGFLAYPVDTVASIMFDSIHKCAHQSLKEVRIVIYTSENDCFKVCILLHSPLF